MYDTREPLHANEEVNRRVRDGGLFGKHGRTDPTKGHVRSSQTKPGGKNIMFFSVPNQARPSQVKSSQVQVKLLLEGEMISLARCCIHDGDEHNTRDEAKKKSYTHTHKKIHDMAGVGKKFLVSFCSVQDKIQKVLTGQEENASIENSVANGANT